MYYAIVILYAFFHVKLKKMVSFNTESKTHSGMKKKWMNFKKTKFRKFCLYVIHALHGDTVFINIIEDCYLVILRDPLISVQ
jgi:hypothetical protein